MDILCLCKRRPQGRDLLQRPYGRFYYLPYYLCTYGHSVTVLLLSYRNDPDEFLVRNGVTWYSRSLLPLRRQGGPARYLSLAASVASQRPDWIVGFSDTWYGVLAYMLASIYDTNSLIDAYDNYESYIPAGKPLHWLWRKACRHATALSAAGPELLSLLTQNRSDLHAAVVPMAADPGFRPLSPMLCRQRLGLPKDRHLVGYCGSLHPNRGVDLLFEAIHCLKMKGAQFAFVISGRRHAGVRIPNPIDDVILNVGYLPDSEMPYLINAMDVLVVVNKPSAFGEYSYPAKLCEALQCHVPVIATSVAGTQWMLREHPECLVPPGDALALANKIFEAFSWGRIKYREVTSWEGSARRLHELLVRGRA